MGIIHRNLKPAHLLLTHDTETRLCLKLADFGSARHQADHAITPSVGTVLYQAPELFLGLLVCGAQADMWSAGAILGDFPVMQEESEVVVVMLQKCGPFTEAVWPGVSHLPRWRLETHGSRPAGAGVFSGTARTNPCQRRPSP
jgi:serine/threonine protein kinase